jgi:hypothetical protein
VVTISELETDPYPAYARLRREEPVSWVPEARQWLEEASAAYFAGLMQQCNVPGVVLVRP